MSAWPRKGRGVFWGSMFLALSVCLSGLAARAQQPAGQTPPVRGMFAVQEVNDLGEQARVTVRIRLINGGDSDLPEARLTLRHVLFGRPAEALAPVVLRAHSQADLTQQVLIRKPELPFWQSPGARLRLVLTFRDETGSEVTHTIVLRYMPALGKEQ